MGMLAMRILTSSGKIYLEYVITKVREEMEARQDTQESPRHIGFNEEGVYDAADYRTVYTLVTNRYGKWEYEHFFKLSNFRFFFVESSSIR